MVDSTGALPAPTALPAFVAAPRRTAHMHVLGQLRSAILGGRLAPGTPLVLPELAAQLRVSRTPIREAIRDLVAEGLVDFDSYRTSVVHTPTLNEAREVYELRFALEPLAARRAVEHVTDAQIERARGLADAMRRTDDRGQWVQLNRDFHAQLLEPAGSPRLLAMIATLRDAAAIQVGLSLRAKVSQLGEANEEHDLLLDAYSRRDTEEAVELTLRHLRSTLEVIEAYERHAAVTAAT